MDIFFAISFVIAHLSTSFQAFGIGTYGVTYYDILLGFFYLICLKRVFWNGVPLKFTKSNLYLYFGLLFLGIILSGFNILETCSDKFISQYFKTCIHFMFYFIFPILATSLNFKKNFWLYLIKAFIVSSIIINIFGIYQIVARAYDLPLAELPVNNISIVARAEISPTAEIKQLSLGFSGFFRATSVFSEPSCLAYFDATVLIFLIVPFFQNVKPFIKSNLVNILALIFCIIALFLTFSLTGMMLVASIVIGLIFLERTKRVFYIIPIIFMSSLLIIISDLFVQSYSEQSVLALFNQRILGIMYWGRGKKVATVGESYGYRQAQLRDSYKLWTYFPILGSGMGSTENRAKEVGIGIGYAISSFSAIFSETGIIGTIGFVGIFFIWGYYSIRFIFYLRLKYKIPREELAMLGILPYLFIIMTLYNFITANSISASNLWHFAGLCFYIIFEMNKIEGKEIYAFRVAQQPFKFIFYKNINKYISMENR